MAYKTRQKEELLKLLATVPNRHFTVAELCVMLAQQQTPIGATTVYRQLEKLVVEGLVMKYVTGPSDSAAFEYVGPDRCHDPICFHCKCTQCGELVHVHCDELKSTEEHLRTHHGFHVDVRRTVFYGLCARCARCAETAGA